MIGDPSRGNWQRRIRREVGWLMLAKLAALLILWGLFFSPAHRLAVDGRVTADRFALVPGSTDQPPQATPLGGRSRD